MTHTVIRGFLANPFQRPPLKLTFQWNPAKVQESKSVNYETLELGGFVAPLNIYSSGGPLVYRFDLMFDATADTRDLNVFRVDIPGIGVHGAVQTLMSFLYPESKKMLSLAGDGFGEPPVCYFGLGVRVFRGIIKDVQVEYSLYDQFLTPMRATASVTFTAQEDGVFGRVNAIFRRMAVAANIGNI